MQGNANQWLITVFNVLNLCETTHKDI